jgi:hypothetical protein
LAKVFCVKSETKQETDEDKINSIEIKDDSNPTEKFEPIETILNHKSELMNTLNHINSHLFEIKINEKKFNKWKVSAKSMDRLFLILAIIYSFISFLAIFYFQFYYH